MKNITYLLGAGASFEALPIVEKIPERLSVFAGQFLVNLDNFLKHDEDYNLATKYLQTKKNNESKLKESFEIINRFYKDIIWLRDESNKHTSIDTFAKKLYLQGSSDLKKLKYMLSCFFMYEQTLKFDKRYDSFFASILENLNEIPKNIKIISWNYDSQLEIAFSRFSNKTIENSREALNVISKGNEIINKESNKNFGVFKVNGTTSVLDYNNNIYDLIIDYNIDDINLVSSFLEIYGSRKLYKDHNPNMSFAWENTRKDSIFKTEMMNSIKETDILVVIGYSFPFFNRKLDKFILQSMRNLKTVYVQDPNNSKEIIEKITNFFPNVNKSSFDVITRQIDFIPKTFKDQFFIPIEF